MLSKKTMLASGKRAFIAWNWIISNIFMKLLVLRALQRLLKKGWVGNLSLGASDNLCNYVLPSLFGKFCKLYPQIKVNLLSSTSREIKNELLTRYLELGIFYTHPREAHFLTKKIGFVEFVIIVPGKRRPNDLYQAPHIGCGGVEYVKSYPVLKMLKYLGIHPDIEFEVSSQETQKRLVQEGLGYAVVPRFMVTQEVEKG
ncbi:MAG: substrate-binding domain-containing protein, partial [Deltaproteobacteria bacterium]|nr:substrate-binding domain-containing protein [Deltaproteobacteria bacterium]